MARLHAIGGANLPKLLGLATVREAKLLVHRKTGTTGRSIHVASVSSTSVTVEAGFGAVFLEEGTKPHMITPKAKLALRWATSSSKGFRLSGRPSSAKGNVVGYAFAKIVHHPGTKPYPFLMPGARTAVQKTGANAIVTLWDSAA
jgi:hypothetical protein